MSYSSTNNDIRGNNDPNNIANREATLVESFSQMNVDDPRELDREVFGGTVTGKSKSAGLIFDNVAISEGQRNEYSRSESESASVSGSGSGSESGSESESETGSGSVSGSRSGIASALESSPSTSQIGSGGSGSSMRVGGTGMDVDIDVEADAGTGTGTSTDVDVDTVGNKMSQVTSGTSSLSPNSQLERGAEQVMGQQDQSQQLQENVMVPVDITWQQGGEKVYVTGSFTGWRKMIGLVPVPGQPGLLHVKLQLPPGTHRFRFIVDNELRFSDYLPTATDQMGNFVNYLEVPAPRIAVATGYQPGVQGEQAIISTQLTQQQQQQQQNQLMETGTVPRSEHSRIALEIENEPDDMGNGFSRFREEVPLKPHLEYTQDIPAVFTDPTVMEQYYLTLDQQRNNHHNMAWLTPPQLPPHLENVILNSYSNSEEQGGENNSGALPIPNHVILNHLATSSIKHNTLCVASIIRYRRKYVTQILYAPLQ